MLTKQCNSYIDFLGSSAKNFNDLKGAYIQYICVYALSANTTDKSVLNEVASADLTDSQSDNFWTSKLSNLKFAKSSSEKFMCYKFKLADITTESDDEPDLPYSYEELFNENVLKNMYSSTGMQYKHIYSAYNTMTPSAVAGTTKTTQDLLLNNFKTTNNLESDKEFVRSDYYKFFVPETNVIHSRSMLELNDEMLASIGNNVHESFNCLLYCVNPHFDDTVVSETLPNGFSGTDFNVVPISLCSYSKDIILAGNNVIFEPNLNGIVTVE